MTNEETTFLATPAAKVTNARVVIGNQTFAMSGVTSVEVRKEEPKTSLLMGFLVMVLGLGMTQKMPALGAIVAVGGIAAMVYDAKKVPTYHLIFRTAGGEVTAMKSHDATAVDTIASAITDAMVFRG